VSREPRAFVVLGFASTHDALDAEAILGDLGVDAVPIPTPRAISAGCGIALRLHPEDGTRALGYLAAAGVAVAMSVEIDDV
jgi:hypothetical protein